MDLVAADLHSFAPITQSIAGDGANTHGGRSPGAGVLDIHLGTSGVLDHQGGRGTGVGCGAAVGLVDGIPADLQPVLQGCDIARAMMIAKTFFIRDTPLCVDIGLFTRFHT